MLRSVLVPLDGSPFAEAALPFASALSCAARARLRLVLVHHDPPGGIGSDPVALGTLLRQREQEYLAATAARLTEAGGDRIETRLLEGDPAPVLADEIREGGDDLVIMATHGKGPFSRMWLGSVTDYLLRHLSTPILVVRPPENGATVVDAPMPGRVLVPLDSSELSEAVLEPALALSRLAGGNATVILATVVEPVLGVGEPGLPLAVPLDPGVLEEQKRTAEQRLQPVAARLRSRTVAVEEHVITAARPAPAILEAARTEHADWIAMTTHGERGLRRAMLGSVADKVVRGATIPVLVLRPGVSDAAASRTAR